MRNLGLAALCAAVSMSAAPAGAATFVVNFTGGPGWIPQLQGYAFGMDANTVISGSFEVDDTLAGAPGQPPFGEVVGADSLLSFTLTTGTKTWTLADVIPYAPGDPAGTAIAFGNGGVAGFRFFLGEGASGRRTVISTQGTIVRDVDLSRPLTEDFGSYCSDCIESPDLTHAPGGTGAAPEPSTWALLIAGFGLAGAGLRRRRPALAY